MMRRGYAGRKGRGWPYVAGEVEATERVGVPALVRFRTRVAYYYSAIPVRASCLPPVSPAPSPKRPPSLSELFDISKPVQDQKHKKRV